MNKTFDDPILLLKVLGDKTSLRYITKEMRIFKCTSKRNCDKISKTLDLYIKRREKYVKSRDMVLGNNDILRNIFMFLDDEKYINSYVDEDDQYYDEIVLILLLSPT